MSGANDLRRTYQSAVPAPFTAGNFPSTTGPFQPAYSSGFEEGCVKIQERPKRTSLGYCTFRCAACTGRFNGRTSAPSDDMSVYTDVVFLVALWRLRSPLSLRHPAEMPQLRSFAFSHETVRSWEKTPATGYPAPLLPGQLGVRREGKTGPRWHGDETYVKIQRRLLLLPRARAGSGCFRGPTLMCWRRRDRSRRVPTAVGDRVPTHGCTGGASIGVPAHGSAVACPP